MTRLAFLAEAPSVDEVGAGTAGLVVFVLLFAATILLWLNMRKRLRRMEGRRRAEADPGADHDADLGPGGGSVGEGDGGTRPRGPA